MPNSDAWRNDPNAYPLSLSIPLGSTTHGHARIEAFLWGLLPDNDRVLQNWGKRFQVSPKNVFRLITHVGEDCAGAVQFVSPDRLETLIAEPAAKELQWLTEEDVAERLRTLRADHSAWRAASDTGQFSLAGAQPKTALLFERKRWGVPSGRIPTTNILKPPTGEWDGHAENEHFSLQLSRALGLIVPNSSVLRLQDEIAIVVERYGRARAGSRWLRIHQEDMCQALGLHPTRKYESDGGPGIRRIVELLREQSRGRRSILSGCHRIQLADSRDRCSCQELLSAPGPEWSRAARTSLRSGKYSSVSRGGSEQGHTCHEDRR